MPRLKLRSFPASLAAATLLLMPWFAAPAAEAAGYQGLTRSEVLTVLHAASEVGTSGEHLALDGKIVTVPDGRGGTLTAVLAVRFPTADGLGQYVLFWHDKTFLGSDRLAKLPQLGAEAISAGIVRSATDAITMQFARYRPSDPMVAPSLPPEQVTYRWDGSRLVASQAVSLSAGNGLAMTLPRTDGRELTRANVLSVLASATEGQTGLHLALNGKILSVPDGQGGTLDAVPVVRSPSADGYGQYVLLWDDATLIGSDRLATLPNLGEESSQVKIVSSSRGSVTLQFACYGPNDPMYAPSLPAVDVTYHWTGFALQASRAVPACGGNKLAMQLTAPQN